MASYAAVCSLRPTILRVIHSSTIWVLSPSQKILGFAYKEARSLAKYLYELEGSNNERVKAVNAQIREAASKLEDAILSYVSDHFISPTGDHIDVCSFAETAKTIMEENKIEDLLAEEEEEEEDNISLTTDFGGKCSKMVGFSDLFSRIRYRLIDRSCKYRVFVGLVGMAGSGKTTLARKIFEDPEILSQFEHHAFVTIGPKFKLREIMLRILAQLTPDIDEIRNKGIEELGKYIFKTLSHRRYLIVLDDAWDFSIHDLTKYFPDDNNGSRTLMTTCIVELSRENSFPMPFLDKEKSWDLLQERVFGEESLCPIQLEKYGKKIAENCEGNPLTIVVVAAILSKNDKTPEYWKQTAEKKNSVFTDAYDQMFPVLYPSYKYLSHYLKPCFLYTGVFPPSWKITTSKIVKLLSAEGFLVRWSREKLEHFARSCLDELVNKSLVLSHQKCSRQQTYTLKTKTWSLNSAYWHLCYKLARMEKFIHVINSYPHSISEEDIKSQQRLCIHNNVLFGIKEVYNLMESFSSVRSLLCTGLHHQFPVQICFGLRFLRVLDAFTVRFYKFPIEVLELVQLRYLALTCNGNVPASINKLWSLEYLFVHRHMRIKPSQGWRFLPMEIWNMKELRHLQVMGSNLPYCCGAMLPNLITLADISVDSCTAEILTGTPNLKKLGIQIELPPDGVEPWCFFGHLSQLHKLESLKCIIVNPKPRSHVVAPLTAFPSSLRKLNLSGFGYPWEYMSVIAQLPNLEVVKLHRYAFQGPKWEMEGKFVILKFMLIEETDLVSWVTDRCCFPRLEFLIVRHCYKLKGISSGIAECGFLRKMELVDCPSAWDSALQMQRVIMDKGLKVDFCFQCSAY